MIHGKRIGLVGYSCASGLGELNRQIARHCPIDLWLVKPHRLFGVGDPIAGVSATVSANNEATEDFVKAVDVILFCETPFYGNLIHMARRYQKRVVCVPMVEWLPKNPNDWMNDVALFICPTFQCLNKIDNHPTAYFPWPVDTQRFQYRQRTSCERFLFLNGHGGWNGRKGAEIVKQVKEVWPDMPLTVRSQVPMTWPGDTRVLSAEIDNSLIYEEGDVLLMPHSTDGIGLEQLEAMSCGMPVISTHGEPWNEFPAIERIHATIKDQQSRPVDWYVPDTHSLIECCQSVLGTDISNQSETVRQWAEDRDWRNHSDDFMTLVTGQL